MNEQEGRLEYPNAARDGLPTGDKVVLLRQVHRFGVDHMARRSPVSNSLILLPVAPRATL